jgi:hypothetical protein
MVKFLLIIFFTSWFSCLSCYPMLGSFNTLDLSIPGNSQLTNGVIKFSLNQFNQQNQKNFTLMKVKSAEFQVVAGINVRVSRSSIYVFNSFLIVIKFIGKS